jgi:hypothetical protein
VLGSWLHSHEEDTATTAVYRRASYDFPPSRGRKGFELRPDGTLTEKGIGPADRSVHTAGHWRLGEDGGLEFIAGPADQPARALQIESVDEDRLVVWKGAPARASPAGTRSSP